MARRTNKHHLWWPKSHYRTDLEKEFRELPCHIVTLQVAVHNLLHDCSQPPRKPSTQDMVEAVRRHAHRHCFCSPSNVIPFTPRPSGR